MRSSCRQCKRWGERHTADTEVTGGTEVRMRTVTVALVTLSSILTAAPVQQTGAASSVRTFSLYLLGHQIGEERRTETSSASSRRLTFDFKYNDRGTEVALASTLELGSKGEPLHFVAKGRTYRYFSADSEVTIIGTRAHVRDGSKETDIDFAGKPFFPLDNYAPIGVHEELIKYWLARGRPAE